MCAAHAGNAAAVLLRRNPHFGGPFLDGIAIPQAEALLVTPAEQWLARSGRRAFEFQREAWDAYLNGESGLINAPTGTGKTLAAWLGPLLEASSDGTPPRSAPGPSVFWVTPLRALANDLAIGLREPLEALGVPWR